MKPSYFHVCVGQIDVCAFGRRFKANFSSVESQGCIFVNIQTEEIYETLVSRETGVDASICDETQSRTTNEKKRSLCYQNLYVSNPKATNHLYFRRLRDAVQSWMFDDGAGGIQ